MNRRDFLKIVSAFGALGVIDPIRAALAVANDKRQLSYLAHRTAGAEGAWKLSDIEGKIPTGLEGTLYRTAPGQTENHGVTLKHLFDGDAFVSAYDIRDGEVSHAHNETGVGWWGSEPAPGSRNRATLRLVAS